MILIAGATGYIGSRVLKILAEKNISIRCLVRRPTIQKLDIIGLAKAGKSNISYIEGNALDYDSLLAATKGVKTVYYFVHMMDAKFTEDSEKFNKFDREAAKNMVKACRENKVKRIIYLGGMYDIKEKLSLHLESRKEVEEIIRQSGVPHTIFRASVIIGRGAAAFEIIDSVVKKFPVIPIFDWGKTKLQPIFYKDAIKYLVDCLEKKKTINRSFDIGGKEVLSYKELIRQYAKELKIEKRFIQVPGQWRWLSAKILAAIAPVNSNVIYWLVESLANNMVARLDDSKELKKIFGFEPLGFKESVKKIINENHFAN